MVFTTAIGQVLGGWVGQQQGMQNSGVSYRDAISMYQQMYNTYATATTNTSASTIYVAQAVAPAEAPIDKVMKKLKATGEETPLAWLDRRVTEMRVAL